MEMQSAQTHKIKIVCMGDSITEGFGLEAKESYPARLQMLLGQDYEVVNKGVTCSTTMNLMLNGEKMGMPYADQPRYAEALTEKGDIYILMLGTNDAQDGTDDTGGFRNPLCDMISRKEAYAKEYEKILEDVKRAAPQAKLYLGIPIPIRNCIWPKHREEYLQQLMPYYEQILQKHPEITRVDVHGTFAALPAKALDELYQEDGLHPNPKGALLIAKTMYNALVN